jgi:hypothetical protein
MNKQRMEQIVKTVLQEGKFFLTANVDEGTVESGPSSNTYYGFRWGQVLLVREHRSPGISLVWNAKKAYFSDWAELDRGSELFELATAEINMQLAEVNDYYYSMYHDFSGAARVG